MTPRTVMIMAMCALFVGLLPAAQAQDEDSPQDVQQSANNPAVQEDGIGVHVVQRGETLFQIAQQYGITMDALTSLNSLVEPDKLQVGQRLLIPVSELDTPGVIATHIVQPGETLHTIALKYHSTPASLAQVNTITSTHSLYAGQSIIVTQGANGSTSNVRNTMHTVQPGETLLHVAVRYGIGMDTIVSANGLDPAVPLQTGQQLAIPGSDSGGAFVNLPPLIDVLRFGPLPTRQGETLGAYLKTPSEAVVTGRIFDREVHFFSEGQEHFAVIGVHTFTEPGVYPITITVTNSNGLESTYESRLLIVDGGYREELIDLPSELQDLLNPELVQAELEQIQTLMTDYTGTKYFDGLMSLPSTGPVTSQYGTRRAYDGPSINGWHTGADFGGAPGSMVFAPANGMVVFADTLNIRGNAIIIDHGWGVFTGYWHLNEIYVSAGQFVERNDSLGTIGNTGLSTGAHLHWEMWVDGVQVNPLQWLIQPFDRIQNAATADDATQVLAN